MFKSHAWPEPHVLPGHGQRLPFASAARLLTWSGSASSRPGGLPSTPQPPPGWRLRESPWVRDQHHSSVIGERVRPLDKRAICARATRTVLFSNLDCKFINKPPSLPALLLLLLLHSRATNARKLAKCLSRGDPSPAAAMVAGVKGLLALALAAALLDGVRPWSTSLLTPAQRGPVCGLRFAVRRAACGVPLAVPSLAHRPPQTARVVCTSGVLPPPVPPRASPQLRATVARPEWRCVSLG